MKRKIINKILDLFFKRYVDRRIETAIRNNNEKWKQKIIANPDIHREFFYRDRMEKENLKQLYFGTGTAVRLPQPEGISKTIIY